MKTEIKKIYLYTIIICIIFSIIGTIILKDKFNFIKGIVFGTLITILKLKLLHNSLNKAVTMSPKKAHKYMIINYFIRYFITAIVLFSAAITSKYMLFGVSIALISPKFAIYLPNRFKT